MNLKFGTGGLRATMGPGPDHLNLETIQEATLGVAAYAKGQSEAPSAAIAYDSRNHSEEFAREAARVLALKGVKYREATSQSLLTRNLLVYGLGGIVLPFIAIKLLDMLITLMGIA